MEVGISGITGWIGDRIGLIFVYINTEKFISR